MNILLLQGTGNSEQDMARICSRFGRVVLLQGGWSTHQEIWQAGERIHDGPHRRYRLWRYDDAVFNPLASSLLFRQALHWRGDRPYDVVVATNYDKGGVGLLLRRLGLARRCIVLLCDFLPARSAPLAVRVHRRLSAALTNAVVRRADAVWRVSPRIPVAGRTDALTMPLYIARFEPSPRRQKAVAYVGYPTPDHGLDLLFDIAARRGLEVHVLGDSAYLQTLLARASDRIHWHGTVTDRARMHELIKDCYCGYAIYKNVTPDSFLYYGVWSKIYTYWASRLPVVTTPDSYTAEIIQQRDVSKVVRPEAADIERGLLELWEEHERYEARLEQFIGRWNADVEAFLSAQVAGQPRASRSA